MLQLIHDRDAIQQQAREELRKKFLQFDIECVDVLIGRPESREGDTKIETLLDQLRQRQFAIEQVETFQKQLADGLYKIWPRQPFEPGEYAVIEYTEGKLNIQIWDFAIQTAK